MRVEETHYVHLQRGGLSGDCGLLGAGATVSSSCRRGRLEDREVASDPSGAPWSPALSPAQSQFPFLSDCSDAQRLGTDLGGG